jgi:hypothetical protein
VLSCSFSTAAGELLPTRLELREMTLDEFWVTIDRIRDAAPDTPDGKLESMKVELSKLSIEDLQSFEDNWNACLARAYTYRLWAAAYMIGGGCGDDGFWDFRSTLVMQGQAFFEAAIADPDGLADADYSEDNDNNYPFFEGYAYVAEKIIRERGAELLPGPNPHPDESLGDRCMEQDRPRLFPKLAAKFGWH